MASTPPRRTCRRSPRKSPMKTPKILLRRSPRKRSMPKEQTSSKTAKLTPLKLAGNTTFKMPSSSNRTTLSSGSLNTPTRLLFSDPTEPVPNSANQDTPVTREIKEFLQLDTPETEKLWTPTTKRANTVRVSKHKLLSFVQKYKEPEKYIISLKNKLKKKKVELESQFIGERDGVADLINKQNQFRIDWKEKKDKYVEKIKELKETVQRLQGELSYEEEVESDEVEVDSDEEIQADEKADSDEEVEAGEQSRTPNKQLQSLISELEQLRAENRALRQRIASQRRTNQAQDREWLVNELRSGLWSSMLFKREQTLQRKNNKLSERNRQLEMEVERVKKDLADAVGPGPAADGEVKMEGNAQDGARASAASAGYGKGNGNGKKNEEDEKSDVEADDYDSKIDREISGAENLSFLEDDDREIAEMKTDSEAEEVEEKRVKKRKCEE